MWLRSDNAAGVDPDILQAMVSCNNGIAMPYGDDGLSRQLDSRFSEVFGKSVRAFAVPSGTAANALALSSAAGPFDLVICHQNAHVFANECGAAEFYSAGARFAPVPGVHGRIETAAVAELLGALDLSRGNAFRPAVLTVTQATEAGTVYQPEALRALGELARQHGLRFHMDGARFANAVTFLDVEPADLSWRAGIDVLSFGATKNGTMYADAVVFFNQSLAEDFKRRLKRSGHDLSKARFLAAQLLRYLEDDLWLHNARRANAAARELADLLSRVPEASILHPVEGNIVFAALPGAAVHALENGGIRLRSKGRLPDGRESFRLVPSFLTELAEVRALAPILKL